MQCHLEIMFLVVSEAQELGERKRKIKTIDRKPLAFELETKHTTTLVYPSLSLFSNSKFSA